MTDETTKPLDIQFQKRFLPNFLSNIAYFILSFSVGFALVPFFVDSLGYAAYGLIPLATSATSYVTMVIDALNIPVSRYLSISLQRGDKEEANRTFNTVLIGTLGIVLLLVPIGFIVTLLSPSIFDIGSTAENDVVLLFLFVIGSVLVRAWGSNFMETLFAYNRLDLRNCVNIVNTGLQIALIILFFVVFTPSLALVGTSYFIAAVAALIVSIYLSRKTVSYLNFNPKYYSWNLFKEIISVAFWSLVDKFGCILNGTIALLVANIILGDIAGADYSIALTVYNGIISVAGLVTALFAPQIFSYVSRKDIFGLTKFSKSTIKCCGLLISLLVSLLVLFTPYLLIIWMGSDYLYLTELVWIVSISTIMWVTVSPLCSFGVAFLKVRVPAFSALFTGCLNVFLCFVLSSYTDLGIYGIAVATIISAIIHTWVICPIYYAYITNMILTTYIFAEYKSLLYLAPGVLVGICLHTVLPLDAVWLFLIAGVVVAAYYVLVLPRVVLTGDERRMVRFMIPRKISKIVPKWVL